MTNPANARKNALVQVDAIMPICNHPCNVKTATLQFDNEESTYVICWLETVTKRKDGELLRTGVDFSVASLHETRQVEQNDGLELLIERERSQEP